MSGGARRSYAPSNHPATRANPHRCTSAEESTRHTANDMGVEMQFRGKPAGRRRSLAAMAKSSDLRNLSSRVRRSVFVNWGAVISFGYVHVTGCRRSRDRSGGLDGSDHAVFEVVFVPPNYGTEMMRKHGAWYSGVGIGEQRYSSKEAADRRLAVMAPAWALREMARYGSNYERVVSEPCRYSLHLDKRWDHVLPNLDSSVGSRK